MKDMHPAIKHFAPLFGFKHLPPNLQRVSRHFAEAALLIAQELEGPEASTALRKLLEAKDAAVRAAGKFEGTWADLERDLMDAQDRER